MRTAGQKLLLCIALYNVPAYGRMLLQRYCQCMLRAIKHNWFSGNPTGLQVVSEYRKARAIMADVNTDHAPEGVWHNLFQEVDKVEITCIGLVVQSHQARTVGIGLTL